MYLYFIDFRQKKLGQVSGVNLWLLFNVMRLVNFFFICALQNLKTKCEGGGAFNSDTQEVIGFKN